MGKRTVKICDRCASEATYGAWGGWSLVEVKFPGSFPHRYAKDFDLCRNCGEAFARFMSMENEK